MSDTKSQVLGEQGIYNAKELGTPKMLVLGLQHMFAMFGSTVLVPLITGLSVSATLLFAGLGTLLFHLITKKKVPAFLGSSFAFLTGYGTIATLMIARQQFTTAEALDAAKEGGLLFSKSQLLPYACFGVALAGLLYLVLALLFKLFGATHVMKFFPPIVTGPIIISIGLILSQSAINSCSSNWPIALVAILTIIICNIWGKGMVKILPILIGVIASYIVAAVTGNVDFSGVAAAPWVGLPVQFSNTVFSLFSAGRDAGTLYLHTIDAETGEVIISNMTKGGLLVTAAITIVPIAIATMMEHIGDVSAISSTVNRNFIKDPGLHRTLTGDGLATAVASLFGAPANTTYGENTGVLTLTKVFDPFVIRLAAYFAILMSFCPKFSAIIEAMPSATVGGISLVLYGMISAVGVRNIVETQVDFTKSRNVIVAAIILVLSIGINFSSAGAIAFSVGSANIALSGLAVGSLVGIILNAILPGKDFNFNEDVGSETGADMSGISEKEIKEDNKSSEKKAPKKNKKK
ncbi:MAG: uracil-xanthine permease family protein [Lachnospiraceae bacterium]|nr:uracil-xanthine permease family protein [Lachnospiraceae bacterium]